MSATIRTNVRKLADRVRRHMDQHRLAEATPLEERIRIVEPGTVRQVRSLRQAVSFDNVEPIGRQARFSVREPERIIGLDRETGGLVWATALTDEFAQPDVWAAQRALPEITFE